MPNERGRKKREKKFLKKGKTRRDDERKHHYEICWTWKATIIAVPLSTDHMLGPA